MWPLQDGQPELCPWFPCWKIPPDFCWVIRLLFCSCCSVLRSSIWNFVVKSNTKRAMRSLNFNDGLPVITIHKNGYECGHNLVSKTLGCVAYGNSSSDKRQINPWEAGITFYLNDITEKKTKKKQCWFWWGPHPLLKEENHTLFLDLYTLDCPLSIT